MEVAEELFRKALVVHPQYVQAITSLGELHVGRGEIGKVKELLAR